MSRPQVFHWLPATGNTAAISLSQNYSGAGNLILNSNVSSSTIVSQNSGPYFYDRVARTVSFTSTNNLSARTITITGIGATIDGTTGNPNQAFSLTTETLAGPNNNTVESAKIYTVINSIRIDGAANALSAGFGTKGITQYYLCDYDRVGWYASYQGVVYNHSTLTYTIYVSLTKPESPTAIGTVTPYPQVIPATSLGTADGFATQLLTTAYPVAITWATVKATAAEDFYFTFLQQGIR